MDLEQQVRAAMGLPGARLTLSDADWSPLGGACCTLTWDQGPSDRSASHIRQDPVEAVSTAVRAALAYRRPAPPPTDDLGDLLGAIAVAAPPSSDLEDLLG